MSNNAKTFQYGWVKLYDTSGTMLLSSAQIYTLTPPQITAEKIEVSNLSSVNFKEYIAPDLVDGGSFSFEIDYTGANPPRTVTSAVIYLGQDLATTLSMPATFDSDSPAGVGPNGVAKRTYSINVAGDITVS